MTQPKDCPGSWTPLPVARLGDLVRCSLCGQDTYVTEPPTCEEALDHWRGDRSMRIAAHWPDVTMLPPGEA